MADDAKKGLESKEDIREASKGLKRTSKDKSGISTERVNPYDGVKPVMLFHVKGNYFLCYFFHEFNAVEPRKQEYTFLKGRLDRFL